MEKEGVGGATFLPSLWLGVETCSLWVQSDTGAPANCPLPGKKKRVRETSAGQGTVNCRSVNLCPCETSLPCALCPLVSLVAKAAFHRTPVTETTTPPPVRQPAGPQDLMVS